MSERSDLLTSIAGTAADYRAAELAAPTPDHVEKWVSQFDKGVQLPLLREMDHVLEQTYFSREKIEAFWNGLLKTEDLVGADPCAFWKNVGFLDIQGGGNSQREMLALFDKLIEETCGFEIAECGEEPNSYLYLDDAIFTGNRVRRDIEEWVQSDAPGDTTLHVVSIASHTGGQYYANKQIAKAVKAAGKSIRIKWWRAINLEDRKYYTDTSDVLRPTCVPDDDAVKRYVDGMNHKPHLRTPGNVGEKKLFSSDEARQLLEQELLKAGVKIREMCSNLGDTQRPLGHMTLETLGFGSLVVTFRNCPNNAPLALWVGDPWYPLFPRVTNSATALKRFLAMLDADEI